MRNSKIHHEKILSKQASYIETLSQANQALRDQLEFLREKLREQNKKIEILETSLYKINLN